MDPRYVYKPEEYNRQMNEVVSSRCKRNERAKRAHSLYTYIYRLRTFNSSMWGSLRLAPISYHDTIISNQNKVNCLSKNDYISTVLFLNSLVFCQLSSKILSSKVYVKGTTWTT